MVTTPVKEKAITRSVGTQKRMHPASHSALNPYGPNQTQTAVGDLIMSYAYNLEGKLTSLCYPTDIRPHRCTIIFQCLKP